MQGQSVAVKAYQQIDSNGFGKEEMGKDTPRLRLLLLWHSVLSAHKECLRIIYQAQPRVFLSTTYSTDILAYSSEWSLSLFLGFFDIGSRWCVPFLCAHILTSSFNHHTSASIRVWSRPASNHLLYIPLPHFRQLRRLQVVLGLRDIEREETDHSSSALVPLLYNVPFEKSPIMRVWCKL